MKELDKVQVIWFSGYYNIGEGFKTDTGEIVVLNGSRIAHDNKGLKERELVFTACTKHGSLSLLLVQSTGAT